jgi:excisionase family DNA binding protein
MGLDGPAVLVPARIAAILERHADLTALRVRTRGVDPEASAVLEALRTSAMSWRGSATGTTDDTEAEPASESSQWVGTGKAAELAGVTSRAIRKAIAETRLPATEVGGRYRISREDIEHYKATRVA